MTSNQNDVNGCPITGIEKFKNIVDIEQTWPLTFVEQWSLIKVTAGLSTSCYAAALMLLSAKPRASYGALGWSRGSWEPQ
jgi:hypothetical protein